MTLYTLASSLDLTHAQQRSISRSSAPGIDERRVENHPRPVIHQLCLGRNVRGFGRRASYRCDKERHRDCRGNQNLLEFGQIAIRRHQLKLIVYAPDLEVIIQWLP